MSEKNIWQAVLAQIELDLSPANFATWFKNTRAHSREKDKLLVSVPNSFVKEWLEKKYKEEVLKAVKNIEKGIKKVDFLVDQDMHTRSSQQESVPVYQQREQSSEDSPAGQARLDTLIQTKKTGLNPNYTFENFIVGSFNELAHAAASAVVEKPGSLYNPLFIYGRVGLGKTHLLQAVGNKTIKESPNKKIKYLPSERLVTNIISSIRDGTIESLKKDYRDIDLLIVDDVQFLAGKEKTQEEFFHIFNALYQNNKQIILSSDRPPKAIESLAKRLRSRFEGGMIADISFPDLETRIAILKTKAQEKETDLPQKIYEYLAENIKTNIREMEGALNRIILFEKVKKRKPNMDTVKELVKDFTVSSQEKITPRKIVETVADFYNISKADICSSSRKREVVRPRQIAMYLMREKLESSYPSIAKHLGGKDHSTAIYSYNKISKKLEKSEELQKEIKLIQMRFLGV